MQLFMTVFITFLKYDGYLFTIKALHCVEIATEKIMRACTQVTSLFCWVVILIAKQFELGRPHVLKSIKGWIL